MRTWKDVATLVKTRNLNGRFAVRSAAGLPFLLEEGMSVAFVPPQLDVPREARVTLVREVGEESYEVEFDAVSDEETARALMGCHCLVRVSDLGDLPLETEAAFWDGWQVVTAEGEPVGQVTDLVENPGQALLEVERPQANPAYIPVVEAFIANVDDEARIITVTLPEGLLDL